MTVQELRDLLAPLDGTRQIVIPPIAEYQAEIWGDAIGSITGGYYTPREHGGYGEFARTDEPDLINAYRINPVGWGD